MYEISFELDACSVCKDYEPIPTQPLRACGIGHLTHDVHKLQRDLGEALRTYVSVIKLARDSRRVSKYLFITIDK